jgi:GTPase SAR1 family protein
MDRYKITIDGPEMKKPKVIEVEELLATYALDSIKSDLNFCIWDTIKIERSKSIVDDYGKEIGHKIVRLI